MLVKPNPFRYMTNGCKNNKKWLHFVRIVNVMVWVLNEKVGDAALRQFVGVVFIYLTQIFQR